MPSANAWVGGFGAVHQQRLWTLSDAPVSAKFMSRPKVTITLSSARLHDSTLLISSQRPLTLPLLHFGSCQPHTLDADMREYPHRSWELV